MSSTGTVRSPLHWIVPILTLVMLAAVRAQAQGGLDEKQCIFAAAQKLPLIPGLQILDARAVRATQKPKREGLELRVEIDVRAAAQDASFAFVCTTDGAKGIFILSLGMSR